MVKRLVVFGLTACGVDAPAPGARCPAVGPMDDRLSFADVQALGTHNSYHLEPDTLMDDSHAYSHPPLDAQADLGVRAFELDLHLREDGSWAVFHLPVIDPLSTCDDFIGCLSTLRAWSDEHPCHTPLMLWLEPKDDVDANVEGLMPIAGHIREVDAAIASVWPDELVVQPRDVPAGVDGPTWPPLAEVRGQVTFALLDRGPLRDEYVGDDPSLAGRTLFVNPDSEADPAATLFKIDDAEGEAARIGALRDRGYVITSNVDSAGSSPADNRASFDASLESGPHYLASDFVVPGMDGYVVTLPGGSPRCHPDRVDGGCGADALEPVP